jgi:type II secretory ATPase GspE/PulE/Tfp pilus assembly ATPase PilB-like protein
MLEEVSSMGQTKKYMVLEGGERIIWNRNGQTFHGVVDYVCSDTHSITDEAYVVSSRVDGVLKEYTVYPSEVSFDKMITARKKTLERMNTLMGSKDLNDD